MSVTDIEDAIRDLDKRIGVAQKSAREDIDRIRREAKNDEDERWGRFNSETRDLRATRDRLVKQINQLACIEPNAVVIMDDRVVWIDSTGLRSS